MTFKQISARMGLSADEAGLRINISQLGFTCPLAEGYVIRYVINFSNYPIVPIRLSKPSLPCSRLHYNPKFFANLWGRMFGEHALFLQQRFLTCLYSSEANTKSLSALL